MYINKHHIDNYIRCPYMFALNVLKEVDEKDRRASHVFEKLSKTRSTSKSQLSYGYKRSILDIKNHISEIASYEMKNDDKVSLADYRIKYTNKFFSKPEDVLSENVVPKLNRILEIFASNAFIGYNVPVDIPIHGTSIMYRDIIDFVLTDSESNIIIVEFSDLSNFDLFSNKLNYWPHYRVQYSFIAASFDKEVQVVHIDPDDFVSIKMNVTPDSLDIDTDDLVNLVYPMQHTFLIKNLYSCRQCEYSETCL